MRQKFDEIAQVRANTRIGGLIEEIRQRAAGVPLLEKFDQVRPKQGADPNELGAFVKWANALLNELQTPDWPGRYDLEVFAKEAAPVWDPSVLSREAVESWRSEAGKYHVWSECPWKDDDLSGTVEGLKNKIEQG